MTGVGAPGLSPEVDRKQFRPHNLAPGHSQGFLAPRRLPHPSIAWQLETMRLVVVVSHSSELWHPSHVGQVFSRTPLFQASACHLPHGILVGPGTPASCSALTACFTVAMATSGFIPPRTRACLSILSMPSHVKVALVFAKDWYPLAWAPLTALWETFKRASHYNSDLVRF